MSFSHLVKEELARYKTDNKKMNETEIIAIINNTGKISVNNEITELKIMTESVMICKRFYELVKKIYAESMKIDIVKSKRGNKKTLYTATLSEKSVIEDLIEKLIHPEKNIKDARAYVRGCFLAIGFITDPEKDYHLEFVNNDMRNAKLVQELLTKFDVRAKIIKRKNDYIVYIKESEQISMLLNVMHAHDALLKMEDIRIKKEMINNVNRVVNCETANLNKIVSASIKQIADIQRLIDDKEYDALPDGLKQVAEARLANKEASLIEIADTLGLSKSCVNHRFRKISELSHRD